MHTLDLSFSVIGNGPIPADHAYPLYSALSRQLPAIHAENGVAIHPIRGRQIGDRLLEVLPWSRLVFRTSESRIGQLIQLAGKSLTVAGRTLRIGVPRVEALTPAPTLRSRLVTIKNGLTPKRFQSELRRKLDHLGVSNQVEVTLGKRRTLRIKHKEIVGYETVLEALTAEESLAIQENRPSPPELAFARRHMGCGIFVPFAPMEARP